MPIVLNYTNLNTCENVTGWTGFAGESLGSPDSNGGLQLAVSDSYNSREGTNCLEWGCDAEASTSATYHGIVTPTFTAFDIRQRELGFWFLKPESSNDEAQILHTAATNNDAAKVRLYDSSGNWAEWNMGGNDTIEGGWNFLRVSGDDPEGSLYGGDSTSSTTTIDWSDIVQFAFLTLNKGANNNKQNNGDSYYGIDWIHSYNTITVTGGTASGPITMDDIVTEANTKPFWGQVVKSDIFYNIKSKLEFGTTGATDTYFAAENEYLYFDPFDPDVPYGIECINGTGVTDVRFGFKNDSGDGVYAQNGCQIINSKAGYADIIVQNGALLKFFASRVEGWDTISLGQGTTGTMLMEAIKTDFFNNNTLELRTTNLQFTDIRAHFTSGNEAAIGTIYRSPDTLYKLKVFNTTDAFVFRAATTAEEYEATDNTADIVVLEGITVDMINSTFSPDKLKRIAA